MRLIDADPFKKDLQDGADRHEYGWDSYDKGAYQAYTDAIELLDEQPTVESEQPPEMQDILNYLDTVLHPIISPEHWDVYSELHDMISALPSVQPEPDINDVTCDNCDYSEKFVGGLILCRRTKTSHRVSATSTCGKGKREVEDAEAKI